MTKKILVNRDNSKTPVITMYCKQLENVQNFKYLGTMLTDNGNSKKKRNSNMTNDSNYSSYEIGEDLA